MYSKGLFYYWIRSRHKRKRIYFLWKSHMSAVIWGQQFRGDVLLRRKDFGLCSRCQFTTAKLAVKQHKLWRLYLHRYKPDVMCLSGVWVIISLSSKGIHNSFPGPQFWLFRFWYVAKANMKSFWPNIRVIDSTPRTNGHLIGPFSWSFVFYNLVHRYLNKMILAFWKQTNSASVEMLTERISSAHKKSFTTFLPSTYAGR